MQPIRILLADDHPLLRSGIRHAVEQEADMAVVGEANAVQDILPAVRQVAPTVAILGVEFPDGNGLDVCRRLHTEFPAVAVLIFSAFDHDDYLAQAYAAGAAGYLVKEACPEILIGALRRVARGERIFTPEQRQRIRDWQTTVEQPLRSLTPREREVLRLVAQGLTNPQIADALQVSLKTVELHVQHIRGKLGLEARPDSAFWAAQLRWLEP